MEEPALFSGAALRKKRRRNSSPVQPGESPGKLEISKDQFTGQDQGSFQELGLAEWLLPACKELGIRHPTPVQRACIPQILRGKDVLGMAQTGSGKTAAFALPILQKLGDAPSGVFALVITPTRDPAFQICDQFKALGSGVHVRCSVIVGGMDMTSQAQSLTQRPHIVVGTPGRIKAHLSNDPGIAAAFSRTKFLVLDEADQLLDARFEEELRVIFNTISKQRQTLLFSATMTGDLQALRGLFGKQAFFYQAYELGLKTLDSLDHKYLVIAAKVKDVHLAHLINSLDEQKMRSVIIFVSRCRTCHLLSLILEELGISCVALHSVRSQPQRLAALNRFKSGQSSILIATDVASRGLDIPTVDLVLNYDFPRNPLDYVHRVGRTARAGRGGRAISMITEFDVELLHKVEDLLGKKPEEHEHSEAEALKNITKVFKARRVAVMKMEDSGFQEMLDARKQMKVKALKEKGLWKKRKTH